VPTAGIQPGDPASRTTAKVTSTACTRTSESAVGGMITTCGSDDRQLTDGTTGTATPPGSTSSVR